MGCPTDSAQQIYSALAPLSSLGKPLVRPQHLLGHRWKATKGHHFPDAPYVEYSGEVPQPELESVKSALEAKARELVAQDAPVAVRLNVSQEEAARLCGELDAVHRSAEALRLVS
ncbi:MAG: hypothetical protein MRJ68_18090, partial [Nitrospira sp.]|nr:hypothetical protein [Nitrospira sp.]